MLKFEQWPFASIKWALKKSCISGEKMVCTKKFHIHLLGVTSMFESVGTGHQKQWHAGAFWRRASIPQANFWHIAGCWLRIMPSGESPLATVCVCVGAKYAHTQLTLQSGGGGLSLSRLTWNKRWNMYLRWQPAAQQQITPTPKHVSLPFFSVGRCA